MSMVFETDLHAHIHRAATLANNGRLTESIDVIERIIGKDLVSLETAHLAQIVPILNEAGLYNILDRIVRYLLGEFPNDNNLIWLYAESARQCGELETAMARAKVKGDHDNIHILTMLANIAMALGDMEAAVDYVGRGLRLDKNHKGIRTLAIKIAYFHEQDYPFVVDLCRDTKSGLAAHAAVLGALAADSIGDHAAASQLFNKLRSTDPTSPKTLLLGYELARRHRDWEKALDCFNSIYLSAGLARISHSWVESGCQITELRCEGVQSSTDKRLVSVVMTVHRWHYLVYRAVQSILEQSHRALELIIVDDGSPSEDAVSIAELSHPDTRIRIARLGENKGTYAARNFGISLCNGEFITFMDSDDWSHPQRIEKALFALDKAPESTVAVCDICIRLRSDGELHINTNKIIAAPVSLLSRATTFERVGAFHEKETSSDSEYLRRLEKLYGDNAILYTETPTIVATRHVDSLTGGGRYAIDWRGITRDRLSYNLAYIRTLRVSSAVGVDVEATWERESSVATGIAVQQAIDTHIERHLPNLHAASLEFDTAEVVLPKRRDQGADSNGRIRAVLICEERTVDGFNHALNSLLNQTVAVDEIIVCCEQPVQSALLNRRKVRLYLGRGSLSRVAGTAESADMLLLTGDDFLYPPDYVERMASALDHYGEGVVVGVESMVVPRGVPPTSPAEFQDAVRRQRCWHETDMDCLVNMLGSGTMALHAGDEAVPDVLLDYSLDLTTAEFAARAQETGATLVSVRRRRNWVRQLSEQYPMPAAEAVGQLARAKHWRVLEYYGGQHSRMAMLLAADKGDLHTVERLVASGGDVDEVDAGGRTALHHAARRMHLETCACLICHGADRHRRDTQGKQALNPKLWPVEVVHTLYQRVHRYALPQYRNRNESSGLSRKYKRDLDQSGIVRIPKLLSGDTVGQLQRDFADFVEDTERMYTNGGARHTHYDCESYWWPEYCIYVTNNMLKYSNALLDICLNPELRAFADSYLGKRSYLQRVQAMRYLSSVTAETHMFRWHHDMEDQRFKLMILLTDVDTEGQYMSYVLGSHKLFHPYDMFQINRCPLEYLLEKLGNTEIFNAVGAAGDAFVFDSNGAHRGNRSARAAVRDVIIVEYTSDKGNIWGYRTEAPIALEAREDPEHPLHLMLNSPVKWEANKRRKGSTWINTLSDYDRWLRPVF